MALKYKSETVSMPNNSGQMFELVRKIPYVPENKEILKEPKITLSDGGDCDDKTILICAWAAARKIPFRVTLAGIAEEPGIYHHVFPELCIGSEWVPYDATYSYCKIDQKLPGYNVFKNFEVGA